MSNNLRTGWRAWLFGSGGVAVEVEHLPLGHLVLVEHDGGLRDLGPCSLEDLRLIAFVAQEAYVRLPSKRGRSKSTPNTLARVRNLTRQFWQASEDPSKRSRRVPGRDSVAVGVNDVVSRPEQVLGATHALDPVTPEA